MASCQCLPYLLAGLAASANGNRLAMPPQAHRPVTVNNKLSLL